MSKGPTLSNIAWIAAIVLVLTFLIVVVAWMSSGKLKVENPEAPRNTALAEEKAEPSVFVPEPGGRNPQESPAKEDSRPSPVQTSDILPDTPAVPVKEEPRPAPESSPAKVEPPPVIEKTSPPPEPAKTYALQLGAFSSVENARAFEKRLAGRGFTTTLKEKGNLTAVLITGIKTSEEALKLKDKLEKENIKSSLVTYP